MLPRELLADRPAISAPLADAPLAEEHRSWLRSVFRHRVLDQARQRADSHEVALTILAGPRRIPPS